MKLKNYYFLTAALFYFSSCGDISQETEKRLDQLMSKTESLDSLINKEFDKVLTLDTLISKENGKLLKLDSLINKSTSRIDSVFRKNQ